ncbi:MAG TPA: GatB/YqeY domain-containing protein [Longimicrobiales bacterium]|nr:GatB/YqeY domain-containing protein [Longimicrobiales bacterium]
MSSKLKSRVQSDLNEARKQRDRGRTLVLSTLLAEIRNHEIDRGTEADDDAVVQVVTRAIKQRKDAAAQMRAAHRDELAATEETQAEILGAYLPEGLTEEEVRGIVRELVAGGASQMGAVMGQLMPRIRGRFDGKEANRIVREELGG